MPNYSLNHARSGSDTRTASTSPLRNQSRRSEASPILPSTVSYFHVISRAAGPGLDTADIVRKAMLQQLGNQLLVQESSKRPNTCHDGVALGCLRYA